MKRNGSLSLPFRFQYTGLYGTRVVTLRSSCTREERAAFPNFSSSSPGFGGNSKMTGAELHGFISSAHQHFRVKTS